MTSPANPFSPRAVLALVGTGAILFVALLWMIGAGLGSGSTNDGGGHAGGKGLNGYAALAGYLEHRSHAVRRSQSPGALDDPGLLVLTPPHHADGAELERIVAARRHFGPTLIVTPKWIAGTLPTGTPGAQKGWVALLGQAEPEWPGFLDDVSVAIGPMRAGRWQAGGLTGKLPDSGHVLSGRGERLVPLVKGGEDGRVLAAYVQDDGFYPELENLAINTPLPRGADEELYPVVVVFEPDLLDNYGMASMQNALFADLLFAAMTGRSDRTVIFDLTLNGLARSANLLTLAFAPPYLAATLCLLAAALVAAWRAFLRFGPAQSQDRPIAFGKTALVANAAGLLRRAGRLHLIAAPYADAVRDRCLKLLAMPRQPDPATAEAAIDRALLSRHGVEKRFSSLAGRLRNASAPHEILHAARDLHALERTLTP